MFNVGGGELLVIMLLALIVLGPQRLPDAARTVGRVMSDLRRISSGFQQELKDAFDDGDSPTPLRRKESVPLASTVAEADAHTPGPARDSSEGSGEAARSRGAADAEPDGAASAGSTDLSRDGGTAVAPAVAAALDEIVTPLEPPAGAPPGDRAETSADDADDAVGDQRAAS
jgi:sec-independent protein translocase protein TatB